ncbi:hypothetical protein [Alkalispirochaeta alkalica]|uniref:hypothetical protein n=1 Tax=Alkalispirochaeta alkalica TaxID=46356 RepID=UPI0003723F26|nr:hypothetical protein [Alkalispirochaeta alkalica]
MNQVPTKRGVRLLERLGGAMVILAAAAMVTAVACDTGTSSSSGPRRQEAPSPLERVGDVTLISEAEAGGTLGVIHFVIEALDQDMSQHTGSVTVAPDGVDLASILEGGGTVTIEFDDFKPATPTGFPESLDGFKLDGEITVGVSIGDGEESLTLSGSLTTGTSVPNISFQNARVKFTRLPLGDHDEAPAEASGTVTFGGDEAELSTIVDALRAVASAGDLTADILVGAALALLDAAPGRESVTHDSDILVEWLDRDAGKLAIHLDGYRSGGGVTLRGRFDMTVTQGENGWESLELDGALTIQGYSLGYIGFGAEGEGGLVLSDLKEDKIPGDAQGWVITDSRRYNAGDLFSFGRFLEDMGIMGGD